MAIFVHLFDANYKSAIARKIKPQEIIKIYQPPKVTGWRYYPDAHGSKPCGCEYCQLGQPYSRNIRERFERENN